MTPNFHLLDDARTPCIAFEDGSILPARTVEFLDSAAAAIDSRRAAAPVDHSRHAEIIAADKRRNGRPYVFSLAEMKRWQVDRSTGRLKVVKTAPRPRRAQLAPASSPAGSETLELIRGLLAWIDGRSTDPAIVARAAALVGVAGVHASPF